MRNQFFAYLSRMKYIGRWSLMHSARRENLSEHTLEVAIIAHALCVIGSTRCGQDTDPAAAVLAALYHDSSEIITGDLPTPIKYHNPKIREAYGELERGAAEKLLSMLPEDMRGQYSPLLFGSAQSGVRAIVHAADKLSALIKCLEEERMGNREFIKARAATERALDEMHMPEVEIFRSEFLPAFSLTLDELE